MPHRSFVYSPLPGRVVFGVGSFGKLADEFDESYARRNSPRLLTWSPSASVPNASAFSPKR
jgi:hypothetical protein